MKIGIKDIAEKTGVSVTAVSLALNNKPGVSEDTRVKVFAVAKELGYASLDKFTGAGDGLAKVKFLRISRHGHILNSNHEHFIADYIRGIMESAHLHEMTIEIDSFESTATIEEITEVLANENQIDGYIVLATELVEDDINVLLTSGKDMVFIDSYICNIAADFVTMNNMEAVFKVITYFKDHGFAKLGFFNSSVATSNFYLREQAFYKGLPLFGLKVNKAYVFEVDSTFEGAYRDMKEYLENGAELPEAVFACSDVIALGCMKALQEKGITIPDDLAVVAFDNLPMSEMSNPSLSSINVSKRQIGRMALDFLYLKMQHQCALSPMVSMIGVDLIERGSSAVRV